MEAYLNMKKNGQIILLDLNYTLVSNSRENRFKRPFQNKIKNEEYQSWLVDLIRDEYVILITARPDYQKELSLENISRKLAGWKPHEAYFNELDQRPPSCKERILNEYIFPMLGEDAPYFALESNPQTKRMYKKYNIPSVSVVHDRQSEEFIKMALNDTKLQQSLLENLGMEKKIINDDGQKTLDLSK